jgi:hypothetical protein
MAAVGRQQAACSCESLAMRYNTLILGDVAQLGERSVRNAEVEGSIPFVSTLQRLISSNHLSHS